MAEGMAEVQQAAGAAVPLVPGHHRRFIPAAALHQPGKIRLRCRFQMAENFLVPDDAALDDLRHAGGQLPPGQRTQAIGVRQHQGGLIEAADEVFPLRQVQAGFAAYAAVHLGQQGGGHLDQRDAPQDGPGQKARQVAGNAAAQGHDAVRPGEAVSQHPAAQGLIHRQALAALPGGEGIHRQPQAPGIKGRRSLVGHHGPALYRQGAQPLRRPAQQTRADENGIGPLSQGYVDLTHRRASSGFSYPPPGAAGPGRPCGNTAAWRRCTPAIRRDSP